MSAADAERVLSAATVILVDGLLHHRAPVRGLRPVHRPALPDPPPVARLQHRGGRQPRRDRAVRPPVALADQPHGLVLHRLRRPPGPAPVPGPRRGDRGRARRSSSWPGRGRRPPGTPGPRTTGSQSSPLTSITDRETKRLRGVRAAGGTGARGQHRLPPDDPGPWPPPGRTRLPHRVARFYDASYRGSRGRCPPARSWWWERAPGTTWPRRSGTPTAGSPRWRSTPASPNWGASSIAEQPYQDPRVTLVIDDARSFFHRTRGAVRDGRLRPPGLPPPPVRPSPRSVSTTSSTPASPWRRSTAC